MFRKTDLISLETQACFRKLASTKTEVIAVVAERPVTTSLVRKEVRIGTKYPMDWEEFCENLLLSLGAGVKIFVDFQCLSFEI